MNDQYDESFQDPERDKKPGLDVTSLTMDAARHASRGCANCDGWGLATVYDPGYSSSPVINYASTDGQVRSIPGRVSAYCRCTAGRKTMAVHRNDAKDVHYRTPDLEEINGKSSYWLEHDPTLPIGTKYNGLSRAQILYRLLGRLSPKEEAERKRLDDEARKEREIHDQEEVPF